MARINSSETRIFFLWGHFFSLLPFLALVFLLLISLSCNVVGRMITEAERFRPSLAGKGHGYTSYKDLVAIKNSGPSPGGKGHAFPTAESPVNRKNSLGMINSSGPSHGGKGHGFRNNEMVEEIHNSSPSLDGAHGNVKSRGSGHNRVEEERKGISRYENRVVTKGSDRSTIGGKGHDVPSFENLGNIKNSGPSGGGKGH
ncbi:hypothetical protein SSX86_025383 [Deinandra increscens subsp. villosa]|uniref:Uncharacterized protein n=1 Tax=Deinandra increscens subsp. villosa TaxID=3103831 RepID=A0AAP0CHU4_9ASTR